MRFTQSATELMRDGVRTFVEVGPGNVLTGLVKRIAEGARGVAVGTPEDVAAYKAFQG